MRLPRETTSIRFIKPRRTDPLPIAPSSLVTIYANLSVLHATLGEFDLMEQMLDHAAQLEPSLIGRRHEYIFVHAHGLCLLYQGRYSKACEEFDRAAELAHELGDGFLVLFDEVFAAECLVWEASQRFELSMPSPASNLSQPTARSPIRSLVAVPCFFEILLPPRPRCGFS